MLGRVLVISAVVASASYAQSVAGGSPVYKVLYTSQNLGTPGAMPAVVTEFEPGRFSVLCVHQTNSSGPSIFSVTSVGTSKMTYEFQPTEQVSGLAQGTDGKLYGYLRLPPSPPNNSNSWYYSTEPSGKDLQIYQLPGQGTNQWDASGLSIPTPAGWVYDLFGHSNAAGTHGIAAVGRVSQGGRFEVVAQFPNTPEYSTYASGLTFGPDGNFYGTAYHSTDKGPYVGYIYRVPPQGVLSTLASLGEYRGEGLQPLVFGTDGNLYGGFFHGGANHTGELYQVTLSGQVQTVYSFPPNSKQKPGSLWEPASLLQASDGYIYGSTYWNQYTGYSYIFRYDLSTKAVTTVYQLTSGQATCPCKLTESMDGKLIGVTSNGGPGFGVVFSLDIGMPKPLPQVSQLNPASAPVGKKVLLWGNYLLGATAVSFNGTPATTFHSTSLQSVWATVPASATSGPITVTTANGSFTTTQDFTVQ